MKKSLLVSLIFATSVAHATTTYVVTAPPRGSRAEETAMFAPVAAYLTKATGDKFIYEYPGNWLTYTQNMQDGKYDVEFDGPQFVSWRIQHQNAVAILQLPQAHRFVVISNKLDGRGEAFTKIDSISHGLIGRPVCAPAPPNFGTLVLDARFKHPMRRPYIVPTTSWTSGFDGVIRGQCVATVLPRVAYARNMKLYPGKTYQVWQSPAYPNQAITISSRLQKAGLKGKITEALLAPGGLEVLAPITKRYSNGKPFVPVYNQSEYAHIDRVLDDFYGF